MPRKSALLLSLLNLVLKPVSEQASVQSNQLVALPQRPLPTDHEAWRLYWQVQDQPWRTEPEIDSERQRELTACRAIVPNIEKGIYPFKDVKLNRADVEWLLATHENGQGPVNWNDEKQRRRKGLDLRGVDLRQVDLHHLPLARMQGGLDFMLWTRATEEQRTMAVVHMENAILNWTHLEGAYLRGAHLEGASFFRAELQDAHLDESHLENTYLNEAHLGIVVLTGARLGNERYVGPHLVDIYWGSTNLAVVNWSQVEILGDEYEAHQRYQDGKKKSATASLNDYERAVRANHQLAVALQSQGLSEDAIRFAYRAKVLQKHILWLQMLQRGVKLKHRGRVLGAWLFSWFLFLLAGYGYRLWRSFLAYALVIVGFTAAYYLLGASFKPPLSLVNALGLSMTSFHGRGFFPGVSQINDSLTILASIEAFVGLILEATFIATLTQRFFGK